MEFSQPRVYHNCISNDLVRRPTRISYDLVSPPYRTNWVVSFKPNSGTIRRKLLDQLRDALVCSYYVRCVSTQRFLADVSVNHSRTGAVKLLITRRTSQSSKLLRGTVRRTTACPRGRNWAAIQPRSKRMTRPLPSRTLLSSCLRGQCRLTLWEPWTPGPSRRGPAQAFSSIAAMYLCWPALLRRPLRCALDSAPT